MLGNLSPSPSPRGKKQKQHMIESALAKYAQLGDRPTCSTAIEEEEEKNLPTSKQCLRSTCLARFEESTCFNNTCSPNENTIVVKPSLHTPPYSKRLLIADNFSISSSKYSRISYNLRKTYTSRQIYLMPRCPLFLEVLLQQEAKFGTICLQKTQDRIQI